MNHVWFCLLWVVFGFGLVSCCSVSLWVGFCLCLMLFGANMLSVCCGLGVGFVWIRIDLVWLRVVGFCSGLEPIVFEIVQRLVSFRCGIRVCLSPAISCLIVFGVSWISGCFQMGLVWCMFWLVSVWGCSVSLVFGGVGNRLQFLVSGMLRGRFEFGSGWVLLVRYSFVVFDRVWKRFGFYCCCLGWGLLTVWFGLALLGLV